MLQALKKYNSEEAAGLLASVSLSTMTTPTPVVRGETAESRDRVTAVMEEIRRRLRIAEGDESPEARARIDQFLANELAELALKGKDLRPLREKAGSLGVLRPDLFAVEFTEVFRDICQPLGVRTAHVESALRAPDHVRHFSAEDFGLAVSPAVSLFLKRQSASRKRKEEFFLLVMTQRVGATLRVHYAWRVYPSDLPPARYEGPLDYLKGFVHAFGLEFNAGDSWRGRFLFYEEIAVGESREKQIFRSEIDPSEKSLLATVVQRDEERGVFGIALAFQISLTQYRRALKAHGVRIED